MGGTQQNSTHYITHDDENPLKNNTQAKIRNTRTFIQEVMVACMDTTKTGNTKETTIKKFSIRNVMRMGRSRHW